MTTEEVVRQIRVVADILLELADTQASPQDLREIAATLYRIADTVESGHE